MCVHFPSCGMCGECWRCNPREYETDKAYREHDSSYRSETEDEANDYIDPDEFDVPF